jgi:hypothetical protein
LGPPLTGAQAIFSGHDRFDLGRAGEDGQNEVRIGGQILRRLGPDRAFGDCGLSGFAPPRQDIQRVAGVDEVTGHRTSHGAQSCKADLHHALLT